VAAICEGSPVEADAPFPLAFPPFPFAFPPFLFPFPPSLETGEAVGVRDDVECRPTEEGSPRDEEAAKKEEPARSGVQMCDRCRLEPAV